MDLRESEEHRLVQVFLANESGRMFEVYWDYARDEYLCTCPGFERRRRCVHVQYVYDHAHPEAGYPLKVVPPGKVVPEAYIVSLMADKSAFRTFVLEHCEVVVL